MSLSIYVTGDYFAHWGGGSQVCRQECKALENGVGGEVDILDGEKIVPPYYRGLGIPYLQDYFASVKIDLLERSGKGRLKHVHFYSNGFAEAVRTAQRLGAIVTYTSPSHDRRESMEEYKRLSGWEYQGFPYPHIFDDALFTQHSLGLKLADMVIVPSTMSANFLKDYGVHHLTVIPHGIELWPASVTPFPEEFTVAFLGSPGPDKGVAYLVEAWGRLGYEDATLILAGPGTEGLDRFIRQRIDRGKVVLMGAISHPEVVYNQCTVYCAPSVSEGFGITVPEAMAYGRPVVVADGAGAADVVSDRVDGFVVPKRDIDSLAERIDWLKQNPDKVEEMGKKARQTASDYRWEVIRTRYIDLFKYLHGGRDGT